MLCLAVNVLDCFFFFKQKTAYEMRISDWSSDVCSSDLFGRKADIHPHPLVPAVRDRREPGVKHPAQGLDQWRQRIGEITIFAAPEAVPRHMDMAAKARGRIIERGKVAARRRVEQPWQHGPRSEEHTSELQSLMRNSY